MDIYSWYSSLDWFSKIYWLIAIPASIMFAIQMLTVFIGGDMDTDLGDVDMEIEGDTGAGFQFFTLKNLVAFFTIFGWTGLGCIDFGLHPMLTLFISTVAGLIMVVILTSLFYFISQMSEDGTLKLTNALGKMCEVYLTIPKNKSGYGKVQIKVQGSLRELEAMTDEEEDLKSGSLVIVKEIINNQILLVSKNN